MTDYATTYIVGGGRSLLQFDWSYLTGKTCIAVTRSFEKLPSARAVYFSDGRFWGWFKERLRAHPGKKYTSAAPGYPMDDNVERYSLGPISGLSTNPGVLSHGNNSGYAAINLAYHLGAKRIFLLGFDMAPDLSNGKERCHWHDGYPVPNRGYVYGKNMLPYFDSLVEPLEKAGVEIFTVGPSAIRCFPALTFEQLYAGRMRPFNSQLEQHNLRT